MKAKVFKPYSIKFLPSYLRVLLTGLFIVCLSLVSVPSASGFSPGEAVITELEDFKGFYQFPNRVAYVQIVQKDQNLVAKQVWDNREYPLIRKADLIFESKDEEYKLEFFKDETGKITSVKILNRVILTKVNFDPNKEVTLTSDKLKRLEGKYQFQRDKNQFIEISARDKTIQVKQSWDGKVVSFYAMSELDFYNRELSFPLNFILTGNIIKQVQCFVNDLWDKVE